MDDDERGPPPSRIGEPDSSSSAGYVVRDVVSSLLLVAAIGVAVFLVSGVWPPLVAIESGSMQPNMQKGDMVFVTEPDRFAPEESFRGTGIVTHASGADQGHRAFGKPGTVVVYDAPGRNGPPIIHRVRFWVEPGENWYDRANEQYLDADSCEELRNCPAPHAGFVTKGDNNAYYDQASGIAPPVKPQWVTGTARYRVPYVGCARLAFSPNSCRMPAVS
ncbi:S26 family signal peptidase [Natronomonas salina]|uniref:S26 family signal peptidase n=1 Tax=Natronomonas salina TaxID=1710540 RepID=UPI0015B5E34A|nr:S26 family signal peptidase [Natronomonas salina]QLD88031.1 S26 family signal peptidase [Natronomonas salina]